MCRCSDELCLCDQESERTERQSSTMSKYKSLNILAARFSFQNSKVKDSKMQRTNLHLAVSIVQLVHQSL
jgi:hypothetical protein